MPRKPKPPRDDPEESERFIAIAKEIGVDPTGELFERVFPSIAQSKPTKAEAKARGAFKASEAPKRSRSR